jgi:hypothetical protein
VKNFDTNLAVSRILSHRFATRRFVYRLFSLLFFAVLFGTGVTAAGASRWPAGSSGAYQSFSVADFDQDSRPDLASIQPGKSNGPNTDYRVDLQLSAAGRQTFQIVAPIGSVQIASRDVNGDNLPDLVLTSASLKQPVAILLNEGRGTFSRVDPAAFPEAFRESQSGLVSHTDQCTDAVDAPPQSREYISSEIDLFLHAQSPSRFTTTSDSRFDIDPFLVSHFGRAPPFEIRHS